MEARAWFPSDSTSPRRARAFADETLRSWSCSGVSADAQLLVSELVGNAVLHGRSPADLRIILDDDHVRVEVHDGSAQPLRHREQHVAIDTTSGRGLLILDAVATSWGVERVDGGKTVWFELLR